MDSKKKLILPAVIIAIVAIIIIAVSVFKVDFSNITGFIGSFTGSSKSADDKKNNYVSKLESGTYYIRHNDNTCEPVYLGDASFDQGKVVTQPNDNRTVWFREDANKVPTLYKGESLILYSTEEFDETFTFERFEDFGYTFGVRNLKSTDSGRYKISTDPDDKCTYPKSDTDAILELKNKNVILDSISGVPFREPEKQSNGQEVTSSLVTRSCTVKNLTKDKVYEVEIYDGTKGYKYNWTADVWVLGSMEAEKSHKFSFETDSVIRIDIPSSYHSGYYMINGQGIFRYVADGEYFDDNTQFNTPNFDDQRKKSDKSELSNNGESGNITTYDNPTQIKANQNGGSGSGGSGYNQNTTQYRDSAAVSSFNLDRLARFIINAKINGAQSMKEIEGITAIVVTPDGNRLQMSRYDTTFTINIMPNVTGTYQIEIYGLGSMSADLSVNYAN